MSEWEEKLAFRHAPVVLQKVNKDYVRADFITNVDFAYSCLKSIKTGKLYGKKKTVFIGTVRKTV